MSRFFELHLFFAFALTTNLAIVARDDVWKPLTAARRLSESSSSKLASQLPEVKMNVSEVVKYYGYEAATHTVTTADGYILTLFRIQCKRYATPGSPDCAKKSKPVLLQHGLFSNAAAWILNLPHQSLTYALADNGYDVWLGNIRGNKYNLGHVSLRKTDSKFWDFSWQDMAEYDLSAMVDYILKVTENPTLTYVGHSQGTLIGFAKFSSDPKLATKINHFFALAPVSTVKEVKCPPRIFVTFVEELQDFVKSSGYFSSSAVTSKIPLICSQPLFEEICTAFMFDFCGHQSRKNFNETRIPVYMALAPDDTSIKNVIHFGQMVKSGLMQKFDYKNKEENLVKYKQPTPPSYDVEKMRTNTTIFYSLEDALADPTDVHNLIPKIRHVRSIRIDGFSHMDFLWAVQARELVYSHIFEALAEKY